MSAEPFDPSPSLVRDLLGWYVRSHRPMPWRAVPGQTAPAYHVLVSETMLQQTQVATVIDYFNRFIKALPTIEALAAADERQVLRLWQGLGYYRRARHLHAAAKHVVADYAGRIPGTAAELAKLPGIGRYTAGAVASIAFAQPEPLVDGNVARVLSRLNEIDEAVDTTAGKKRLWAEADRLVQQVAEAAARHRRKKLHAGDWNQAMMELGATICTPRQANCERCPVAPHCRAHASGRVSELPVIAKRTRQRPVVHHVFAIERRGKLLWQQRDADGLWANMWQMPTVEMDQPRKEASAVQAVAESLRIKLAEPVRIGSFAHLTTHKRIRIELWHTRCTGGRLRPKAGAWRKPDDLDDLPLPRPQQRALALLRQTAAPGV